jgi:hypothetical protein
MSNTVVNSENATIQLSEADIASLDQTGSVTVQIPGLPGEPHFVGFEIKSDEMACTVEDLVLGETTEYGGWTLSY